MLSFPKMYSIPSKLHDNWEIYKRMHVSSWSDKVRWPVSGTNIQLLFESIEKMMIRFLDIKIIILMNAYRFWMIPMIIFANIINKRRLRVYLYRKQVTSYMSPHFVRPTQNMLFFINFSIVMDFWWRSWTCSFSESLTPKR